MKMKCSQILIAVALVCALAATSAFAQGLPMSYDGMSGHQS